MEAEKITETVSAAGTKIETVTGSTSPKWSPSIVLLYYLSILVTVVPAANHHLGVSDLITILQITFYGAIGVAADVVNFKHTKLLLGKE